MAVHRLGTLLVLLLWASGAQALTAEQDFANRVGAAGVTASQGFDATTICTPVSGTSNPGFHQGTAGNRCFRDTTIKMSGASAFRLEIPTEGSAGSNGPGSWGEDFLHRFDAGQSMYIQWAQRVDSAMLNQDYGSNVDWKQVIIWDMQREVPSCTAFQIVLHNTQMWGAPTGYSECGSTGFITAPGTTNWKTTSPPYTLHQPTSPTDGYNGEFRLDGSGGVHSCDTGGGDGVGFFCYPANTWVTYYLAVTINSIGSANSIVKGYVSVNRLPYKQIYNITNYTFRKEGGADQISGIDLNAYMTARTTTVASLAYTWFDEFIVSTNPIAAPQPLDGSSDTTPPSAPTGVSATTASSSEIGLNWTASTDDVGVTGYNIYRCSGAACTPTLFQSVGIVTSFQNTGLTASTLYRYQVSAVDAAQNESTKSSIAEATTDTIVTLAAPTGLTVVPGNTQARLSLNWTDNTEPSLAGYHVYECSTAACTPNVLVIDAPLSAGIRFGLLGNHLYRYHVKAYDTSAVESAASSVVEATTSTIPAGSPVLRMNYEEGTGVPTDDSGAGHNASVHTAIFSTDATEGFYSAVYNSGQYTRIPQTAALRPTAVTVSAWIKRNGAQVQNSAIVRKSYLDNTGPTYLTYSLVSNQASLGSDRATCTIGFSGGNIKAHSAVAAIPDGIWTHVACTYDPAGGAPQHTMYVNGVLSGTPNTLTSALLYDTAASGDVWIAQNGITDEYFAGQIDDVRIYPRALSSSEVLALAATGDVLAPAAPGNLHLVHP